jgi:hypothetical protein
VSLAVTALILAAEPARESKELTRAREEAARLKELVDAGAIPQARLNQVREQIEDAEDDEILRRTLYGSLSVQDLTEHQATEMMEAAGRRADRQQQKVNRSRELVDSGVASRASLAPLLEDLAHRERAVELASSRAELLRQLAAMARAEQEQEEEVEAPVEPRRVSERFEGRGLFGDSHLKSISAAFVRQFGRALPISAKGTTALHRSLGFDHSGRVDVALSPDQDEGVWLRTYLEKSQVPYIAFRAAVPGKSTAPHIHIGPPSNRFRAAD